MCGILVSILLHNEYPQLNHFAMIRRGKLRVFFYTYLPLLEREPSEYILNFRVPVSPFMSPWTLLVGQWNPGSIAGFTKGLVSLIQKILRTTALVEPRE